MLTGRAREELKKILEFSSIKDLKIIELKVVPGNSQNNTRAEMIESILSCASQPSDVLRNQRLRKSVMLRYLWQCGVPVLQEQSKSDYLRIILNMWQVKDDDYLWRFRTIDEIDAEIDRFQEKMTESLQELKLRIRERRPSHRELRHMKKSMDKFLQIIDSLGKMGSYLSSQATNPTNPPSDDGDTDSSSSTSSVEILEDSLDAEAASSQQTSGEQHGESSRQQEHSGEPLTSQQQPSTNIVETSSCRRPSSVDIYDLSSLQPSSSVDICSPSSVQSLSSVAMHELLPQLHLTVDTEPSSSQQCSENFSEPSSSVSTFVHDNQSMSPSKRLIQATSESPQSKRNFGMLSPKHSCRKGKRHTTPVSNIRDVKRLIQTELSKYFGQSFSPEHKHSIYKNLDFNS